MQHEAEGKPRLRSAKDWMHIILCGICMGAADIVPGISGGTMAFIMGIYDNLLYSIKSVNSRAFKLLLQFRLKDFFQSISWEFLLGLIGGIAFSFITLARFFDYILGHETYRIFLYSGFIGLIIASIIYCARQLDRWRIKHVCALVAGALIAFFLTGTDLQFKTAQPSYDVYISKSQILSDKPIKNYDAEKQMLLDVPESTLSVMHALNLVSLNTPAYSHEQEKMGVIGQFAKGNPQRGIDWWMVCCGAIAISAMLLPGISGSYLLTILGVYGVIIGALADFVEGMKHLTFDRDAFSILGSVLVGILAGALIFSHVVSWLLNRYRQVTIALLTGFMIGAMRSVWPFWTYEYVLLPLKITKGPQLQVVSSILPPVSSAIFWEAVVFALMGFFLVLSIEYLANRKKTLTSQVI